MPPEPPGRRGSGGAGQGIRRLAAGVGLLAADKRVQVPLRALEQPPAAPGKIEVHFRPPQPEPVEIDNVHVGAVSRGEHAAQRGSMVVGKLAAVMVPTCAPPSESPNRAHAATSIA